jgi:cellulose synthase/poly-beta-1,6-N-acetylglucosamine synthase-like glycosyltransferase
MQEFLIIIFILTLFLLFQSYLFYPLSLLLYSRIRTLKISADENYEPVISVIISVYNEEKVIESTIRNLMKSDYDKSKIELVIGSDCSDDNTNAIIRKLSSEFSNIHFYEFSQRRGKANVLNDLVEKASGEILVFSDANTTYSEDAISKMIKYYSDPEIGGVCGRLILKNPFQIHKGNQERQYWEIENWIKKKEGSTGKLIGANGGIYSIKKEYFTRIPSESPVMDDFFISLKVLEQGKHFIYEPKAVAVEEVADDYRIEYRRKIRNNAIDLSTIKYVKALLHPDKGFICYALWSHKIIRWFSPVLLILFFVTNAVLMNYNAFFTVIFWMQIAFYLSALAGYILSRKDIKLFPFNLSFYFVLINFALLVGIYRFITSQQKAHWQSTPR